MDDNQSDTLAHNMSDEKMGCGGMGEKRMVKKTMITIAAIVMMKTKQTMQHYQDNNDPNNWHQTT
ncbi:hypothetical protein [Periweissella fabalis]|uniref:Uncharacterized protein n=1 Tax=Periweissella fabalis TaxID=1070421 RepID=A0A7X6N1X7_9LACO|nr:hypothetical protein [Periweissella fabalis]MCM0599301.1 hypothetical protein [Periweissella fabalis]NKZ23580.1 hypothetical protein [Periweissella fabalis]